MDRSVDPPALQRMIHVFTVQVKMTTLLTSFCMQNHVFLKHVTLLIFLCPKPMLCDAGIPSATPSQFVDARAEGRASGLCVPLGPTVGMHFDCLLY